MIRNFLGSLLALLGAAAAVYSPFRVWYDGRLGRDYRVADLFDGITGTGAGIFTSLLLPFLFAALVTLVGVVLRSRVLVALAGVVVLGLTILWMVRQGQAAGGLSISGDGTGLSLGAVYAFGGGAVLLLAALVMRGRRRRERPARRGSRDEWRDDEPGMVPAGQQYGYGPQPYQPQQDQYGYQYDPYQAGPYQQDQQDPYQQDTYGDPYQQDPYRYGPYQQGPYQQGPYQPQDPYQPQYYDEPRPHEPRYPSTRRQPYPRAPHDPQDPSVHDRFEDGFDDGFHDGDTQSLNTEELWGDNNRPPDGPPRR
ncbi:hypothetical protein ACIOJD_27185 [Streptomyces sp. NPDC088116]|uniref:hypothetical protein n=1 Tax=Streptomyces sp. NPDC088116 TaxID=3365825 RepID=UPI00382D7BD0